MNMYKILVVDDEIKKIKNFKEEYIDNATINNLELKLNQLQYDFIYLDNSLVNEKIIYTLFMIIEYFQIYLKSYL